MYNTILIPVDFAHEEQSIQTLQKAAKLIGDGDIILLHVIEVIPEYILAQLPDEARFGKEEGATEVMQDLIDKSGVKARIEVKKGRSYDGIVKSAKENDVDLIIINSHQPNFEDYLLGSTATKVVRHAPCAVLVER